MNICQPEESIDSAIVIKEEPVSDSEDCTSSEQLLSDLWIVNSSAGIVNNARKQHMKYKKEMTEVIEDYIKRKRQAWGSSKVCGLELQRKKQEMACARLEVKQNIRKLRCLSSQGLMAMKETHRAVGYQQFHKCCELIIEYQLKILDYAALLGVISNWKLIVSRTTEQILSKEGVSIGGFIFDFMSKWSSIVSHRCNLTSLQEKDALFDGTCMVHGNTRKIYVPTMWRSLMSYQIVSDETFLALDTSQTTGQQRVTNSSNTRPTATAPMEVETPAGQSLVTVKPSPQESTVVEPSPQIKPVVKPSPPTKSFGFQAKSVVKPSPQEKTVVKPSPQTKSVVKPSQKEKAVVKPSPQTKCIVKPSPQEKTLVKPSPQTKSVVKPSSQTKPVVKPSPQTKTVVKPNPQEKIAVKPSSQSKPVVKPTSQTKSVVRPSPQANSAGRPHENYFGQSSTSGPLWQNNRFGGSFFAANQSSQYAGASRYCYDENVFRFGFDIGYY